MSEVSDELTQQRIDILSAIVQGYERIHEVIDTVRQAEDEEIARQSVRDLLGVSDLGARAVLSLQLEGLSQRRMNGITDELAEQRSQ